MFSFNYLAEHPSEDLIWNNNLFFVVNKVHRQTLLSQEVKEHWTWKFSTKTILQMCGREFPVLLHHWHGICSMAKKMTLPAVVKTTQRIVSSSLNTTKLIYTSICQKCSQFNSETQKDIGQGLYCIFIISRGRSTEIS